MNDLTRDLYTMKEICKKLEFRLEKEKERATQAEAKNIALTKAIENLKECLYRAEAENKRLMDDFSVLYAERRKLLAEREALRVDAERWAWFREHFKRRDIDMPEPESAEELDAAIDAARQK